MRKGLSIWQSLSLAFATLLLVCCALAGWMQVKASARHEQFTVQKLSWGLAANISAHAVLMDPKGIDRDSLSKLFEMLMVVNPGIEVYLLDPVGKVLAYEAPQGHVKLQAVRMQPIQQFLKGEQALILGDDPRRPERPNIFSVAPVDVAGKTAGYVYIVLQGESHETAASLKTMNPHALAAMYALVPIVLMGAIAGWLTFGWITRPLRQLTASVQAMNMSTPNGHEDEAAASRMTPRGDELSQLRDAFDRMQSRIQTQWQALLQQDQVRRELIANVSHDLRTPLTAMHGYLETIKFKSDQLDGQTRDRYLDLALAQSLKVGKLARELFELARLEYGSVQLNPESFSMADLVQDVFAKTSLVAQQKNIQLVADFPHTLPSVVADVGLIERVLTNLMDNAIRHSFANGTARITLVNQTEGVLVRVIDYGEGVAQGLRAALFTRPSPFAGKDLGERGGLGLLIVRRILQLHDCDIEWGDTPGGGCTFSFALPTRPAHLSLV